MTRSQDRFDAPPTPAPYLCSYGDAFSLPKSGGCCQACRMAAKKYSHYRDSDMDASAAHAWSERREEEGGMERRSARVCACVRERGRYRRSAT